MALFKRKAEEASIVIVSLGGREDLLPDFNHPLGKDEQVLGRDESCSIQVLDGLVSRRHLKIRYDGGKSGYVLEDMGSANGTLVNGTKADRQFLGDGDELVMGRLSLRVHIKEATVV